MGERILFFDGYCSLCNRCVDYLIAHDPAALLKFASLQGETAKSRLPSASLTTSGQAPDTVIYLRDGSYLERSDAILQVFIDLELNPFFIPSRWLFWLPRILRDAVYRWVASSRYRIFGKRSLCRSPTLEERLRFMP